MTDLLGLSGYTNLEIDSNYNDLLTNNGLGTLGLQSLLLSALFSSPTPAADTLEETAAAEFYLPLW